MAFNGQFSPPPFPHHDVPLQNNDPPLVQGEGLLFGDGFNEPPEIVIGIGQFLFHRRSAGNWQPIPQGVQENTHWITCVIFV